jgi:hypothetical protein
MVCLPEMVDGRSVRTRMTDAIEELLDATGTSQARLGRELGMDPATVCRGMRMKKRDWRAVEIAQMTVLFCVPVGFFFGEDVEVAWLKKVRDARARTRQPVTAPLESLHRSFSDPGDIEHDVDRGHGERGVDAGAHRGPGEPSEATA